MNKKNRIEHLWSVLCETALIDSETNNLSLLNVVEQLNISSIPQIAPIPTKGIVGIPVISTKLELVSFFQRKNTEKEELEIDATLILLDPSNKVIKEGQFKIQFPKGMKRLRFRTKINGLPITIPGEYRFNLSIKEMDEVTEICSLPMDVKIEAKI